MLLEENKNFGRRKSPISASLNNNEDITGWKVFDFSHGYYLLHIPSSSFFEVDQKYFRHLQGIERKQSITDRLNEYDQDYQNKQRKKVNFKVNITSIALNVAEKCNLRCGYCFAGDGDYGSDSMMSQKVAIKAIRRLSQNKKNFHISFFGGEPLLNFKLIKQVVKWTEDEETKFSFAITTNGTLLNQSHVDFFKKHGFKVTISYDGPRAQEKNRKALTNAFNSDQLVRNKLEKFKSDFSELNSKLRSTVTKESISEYLDGLFEQLKLYTECHQLSFRNAASSNNTLFSPTDATLLNDRIDELVDFLIKKESFESLLKLQNAIAYIPHIHNGRTNLAACGAGINYLSVSTFGNYYLCHRFTESENHLVGNYKEGLNLDYLTRIISYRTNGAMKCSTCFVKNLCRGGCFHENVEQNLNEFEPNDVFCIMQERAIRTNLRIYSLLVKFHPRLLKEFIKTSKNE